MTTGIVIGKFYPPHRGHSLVINTGLTQVDRLTVIVCEKDDQNISGAQRAAWLKEIHPQAEVRVIPDIVDTDDSEGWAKYTVEQLGYVPDVVFTSEDYGEVYARFMGSRHVMVDKERQTVKCSARFIRENPLSFWDYLEPCVRLYYMKKICVLGAESTGTTSLVKGLARAYQSVWVPEYGRMYAEGKVFLPTYSVWQTEEFTYIAQMQSIMEDQLAPNANRFLLCDTNPFATEVWHKRYMGWWSDEVARISASRTYDLYLLTAPDIPFVQDGTRDGEEIREWMHELFIEKLEQQSTPYAIMTGTRQDRLAQAMRQIALLPTQK
jgi:HTH-type transcriptional regulator, transcriptional repressor of NAD biosynthesis genes